MTRNLDMTALRAFVTVSDAGGVTKASGFLNLTQSAVSMQLKRLEEMVGVALFDRAARRMALTGAGEQMLSYARRMLELNDEAIGRLTAKEYEGEIRLGVPHDIVYPAIPEVMQRFHCAFPRMKVSLMSSYTYRLKDQLERGEVDLILTTEDAVDRGGETLLERPLIWFGAQDGTTWRQRPLKLAYETNCIFRGAVQGALDNAGIAWDMAVESESSRTIEASVSADLAVHTCIEGTAPPYFERIDHQGALPDLPKIKINLYRNPHVSGEPAEALAADIKRAFQGL